MRKQTFQHAEIRDENNEILQKGSYGKNTELVNATNTGVIDFIINNLEWLKNRVSSGNEMSIADYTFKIGNVKNGDVAQATSRIEDNTVYLDLVLPKGNIGDKGERGEKGDKGDPTATIEIGKVETIESTEEAQIKNAGTKTNLILDFYIPKGPKGEKGDGSDVDLSLYIKRSDFENAVEKFATKSNVYTKNEIERDFADISDQFKRVNTEINEKANKTSLRGLATTEYVDGRIKHIVGTAPETLDTLDEIAKALNNDNNFVSTMTNQLATKADKATTVNALLGKADKISTYTKEEINQKLKELPSSKVTDVYTKKEVDDKLNKKYDKKDYDKGLDRIAAELQTYIEDNYYKKLDCDDLFQRKGDYALKSDIPKPQDLTPYAKKTDLINKIEKKDIYQENMLKFPDGTLIGIETKSGGVNNNPINTKDLEDEIGNEPSIKHP